MHLTCSFIQSTLVRPVAPKLSACISTAGFHPARGYKSSALPGKRTQRRSFNYRTSTPIVLCEYKHTLASTAQSCMPLDIHNHAHAGSVQDAETFGMASVNIQHRLITLATCNLDQWAMDFEGNLRRVKESIQIAKDRGATYRVRPQAPPCHQHCAFLLHVKCLHMSLVCAGCVQFQTLTVIHARFTEYSFCCSSTMNADYTVQQNNH